MTAAAEPAPARFGNPITRYIAATRPPFLSATLLACLLGMGSSIHDGQPLNLILAVVTILLALLTHAAVNVLNDYYDALNGTDDANTERVFPFTGGSRFIQNGVLSCTETAAFGYALLGTAMLGGLWLVAQTGHALVLIGAAGLFIGWAYSAVPLKLNSRGLGEACVLAGFLGVVTGTDFVQRGSLDSTPVLIGLPYALLVTNLLYINQFPDCKADAAVGKNHWVVRLPAPVAAKLYTVLALAGLLWLAGLIVSGVLPPITVLAATPWLLAFRAGRFLTRHASTPSELKPAIVLTIAAMLTHGILLSGLLVIAS